MDSSNINSYLILSALIYKIVCLTVGSISIFLGYKLFTKGIWGQAGELESSFKDMKLVLRKAAPGSFFAVLGAVIICFTIITGFKAKNEFSNKKYSDKILKDAKSENLFKNKPKLE